MSTVKDTSGEFHSCPPGTMTFSWTRRSEPPHEMYAAVNLRVDDGYGASQRAADGQLPIDLRRQLIRVKDVGIVAFLARLPECSHTFMLLVNHWSGTYKSPLRFWAESKVLRVFFYEGEEQPVGAVEWPGDFPTFWKPIVEAVEALPMWPEEEFGRAVALSGLSPVQVWETT